jgi:hypothetical protein
MKAVAVLLALLSVSASDAKAAARLFVRISGTYTVSVDHVVYGETSAADDGKLVQLQPGSHHIDVEAPDGRVASFDVTLAEGESKDVTLSPLGFRRKAATEKGAASLASELRVNCVPSDCSVTFAQKTDAIPAGRYPLSVRREDSTLRLDIDIPAQSIVTVEANFKTGTIRTIDVRKRPIQLNVVEAKDALTPLYIADDYKRIIRNAIPAGVRIVSVTQQGDLMVMVFRAQSMSAVAQLLRLLEARREFYDDAGPPVHGEDGSFTLTVTLKFLGRR